MIRGRNRCKCNRGEVVMLTLFLYSILIGIVHALEWVATR